MSNDALRVGVDLDGSLESLGNSMNDLADALTEMGGYELVRFRTLHSPDAPNECRPTARALWAPWWRHGLGRSIDLVLPPVDIVHVAGIATPPTKSVPLIISVDDLRPLRSESRIHQRITQLRRATARGAFLAASSRTASHEVLQVLGVRRHQVVVVPPAVPHVATTSDGEDLVINVTGAVELFLSLAPDLVDFARAHDTRVVALMSTEASSLVRMRASSVIVRARRDARDALASARVVLHFSDGARFPSFAIAALAAGVPTIARATSINRELLDGAAALAASDREMVDLLESIWDSSARRAIMVAAGRSRAVDYAPATAAQAYAALYHDAVRGWRQ
ncbi:MAG TPA: hypothetical protein VMV53_01075 [Acidimicrobiales bacterium]|nr:hypothetical protein [Acidimicrobiales bacterium]